MAILRLNILYFLAHSTVMYIQKITCPATLPAITPGLFLDFIFD